MTASWTCGPGGVNPSTGTGSWPASPPAAPTATRWSATCAWASYRHRPAPLLSSPPTSSTAVTIRWTLQGRGTQPRPNCTPSALCLLSSVAVRMIWSLAISRANKGSWLDLQLPPCLLLAPPSAELRGPPSFTRLQPAPSSKVQYPKDLLSSYPWSTNLPPCF